MKCPCCHSESNVKVIFSKFNHTNYGHNYCNGCGISFDSNVNEILDEYSELNDKKITILGEEEYRKFFVETSNITDGTDNIYTSFDWDNQDELKSGIIRHIEEKILEKYSYEDTFSVLDIGCGDGFTTANLSKQFPNAEFLAIDPSPQVNKLKGKERIRAYQGILQNIDFKGEVFDIVMIFGNLMLHADPFDTLKLAKGLLNKNGLLLFDFKNINSASRVIATKLGQMGVFNQKNAIQRNFVNMRYGLSKEFMLNYMADIGMDVIDSYSKPPRLLEFDNKSKHTQGISGLIWRNLNSLDKLRDEMAWLQFTCRETSSNS